MFDKKLYVCVKKQYMVFILFFISIPFISNAEGLTCTRTDKNTGVQVNSHVYALKREMFSGYINDDKANSNYNSFLMKFEKIKSFFFHGFSHNSSCIECRDKLIKADASLTDARQTVKLYRDLLVSKGEVLELYIQLQAELYAAKEEVAILKAKNQFLERKENCNIKLKN